jgi:hypothetical protein
MYSLTLTVHQVMDLWHVSGSIHHHDGLGGVHLEASFSQDWHLGDGWSGEDEIASMLAVVRQWAEMTSGH